MLQLLAITGQRLSEIANLSWREVDLTRKQLVIPAARMKGKRDHMVPLPPVALAILKKVPEFSQGGYVFTTTHGRQPVSGFSKAKLRLDAAMVVALGGELLQWGFHDLRRTARSGFSPLPFSDTVKERILAHLPRGVHGIYDRNEYLPERRRCLRLWAVHLMRIVGKIRLERNHRLLPRR